MRLGVIALVFAWSCASSSLMASGETDYPRAIDSSSIDAFHQVSKNLYSGGTPKNEAGFRQLRDLGVRTIISVDGAAPNLEFARLNGLRYIHVPMGYGRWSRINQLQLVAAANEGVAAGPTYIHCHHGKHRGPTAVAVMLMGLKEWDAQQSLSWLGLAGTATNYTGLFATVKQFTPPSTEELNELGSTFPESVKPSGLVESMVAVDRHFGNIATLLASDSNARDPHIGSEALLILEVFKELERDHSGKKFDDAFVSSLRSATGVAERFHASTQSKIDSTELRKNFDRLKKSCKDCHRSHRDSD